MTAPAVAAAGAAAGGVPRAAGVQTDGVGPSEACGDGDVVCDDEPDDTEQAAHSTAASRAARRLIRPSVGTHRTAREARDRIGT